MTAVLKSPVTSTGLCELVDRLAAEKRALEMKLGDAQADAAYGQQSLNDFSAALRSIKRKKLVMWFAFGCAVGALTMMIVT